MSSEYPRMMYNDWPEYKVAHTAEEAEAFKKKGYVFEAWGAEVPDDKPEEIVLPEVAPEKPKKAFPEWRCKVCGRHLKKFSHDRCKAADTAGA